MGIAEHGEKHGMTSTPSSEVLGVVHQKAEYAKGLFLLLSLVFGFSFLPAFELYRASETLLVLVFLGYLVFERNGPVRGLILRDPIFKLCAAFALFMVLAYLWNRGQLPAYIEPSFKVSRHYIKPLLILIIALGLALVRPRCSWMFLVSGLLGAICYLAFQVDGGQWSRALNGARSDFGIHNAQHTGLLFGMALLALVAFTARLVIHVRGKAKLMVLLAPSLLIPLTTFIVLAAQTRATWLGLVLAAPVMLVALYLTRNRQRNGHGSARNRAIAYATAIVAIAAFVFSLSWLDAEDIVDKRLGGEAISLESIGSALDLTNESPATPLTSSGVRIASWAAAAEWIGERPLAGWGAGATKGLIDHSEYFSEGFKNAFGHLHNSFLEVLVAHGLIGGLLFGCIALWLGASTVKAYNSGTMPRDAFVFAWGAFTFWLVVNMFESYILYPSGQYVTALIFGFIYSFYIRGHMSMRTVNA